MDIDLVDGNFYVDDPHTKYTWMREHAPVYFDAKNGVWGLASYEAVLERVEGSVDVLERGGIRPETPALPMMIDKDDPEHLRRRKLVNRGFTPRRVRDSEPKLRDVCGAIIDRVCEQGVRLRQRHCGPAPDGDDRRHARRRTRRPRRSSARWSDDMVGASGTNDEDRDGRGHEH